MTQEQFDVQSKAILAGIPVQFHSALSTMAYEDGHPSGYEEVLNILRGLVWDLKQPIADYRQAVRAEVLMELYRSGELEMP